MFSRLLGVLFLSSCALIAQVTGQLVGAVTDAQGAAVVGAAVEVIHPATNNRYAASSNDKGEWIVPALQSGIYQVTVKLAGFRAASVQNVKVDVGSSATVNVVLEIGTVSETVEVSGGSETLQTNSASVSTTLVGRQINQLPMNARNGTELLVLLPGTATPGTSRTSSINGLPKGSMNMTLDGINIQDNYLKSSDGFFATVQPKPDSIEEVSVTTASGAADVLGQGAAQVRFVTKSGTNQFHGSAFWQHRNTVFNSNYYFNTIDGIARDRLILNQFGGSVGGPIKKDKLFFFTNMEWFRLPQSYTSGQLLAPTNSALTVSTPTRILAAVCVASIFMTSPVMPACPPERGHTRQAPTRGF